MRWPTFKLLVVRGSSLSSYSPVTSTSRSTSSFRHLTELTGRWKWRADTRWARRGTSRRYMLPSSFLPEVDSEGCCRCRRWVAAAAPAVCQLAPVKPSSALLPPVSAHLILWVPSFQFRVMSRVTPPPHVRLLHLLHAPWLSSLPPPHPK